MNGWCYFPRIFPSHPSKKTKVLFRSTEMIFYILKLDNTFYTINKCAQIVDAGAIPDHTGLDPCLP
jgi:hypothetical protein